MSSEDGHYSNPSVTATAARDDGEDVMSDVSASSTSATMIMQSMHRHPSHPEMMSCQLADPERQHSSYSATPSTSFSVTSTSNHPVQMSDDLLDLFPMFTSPGGLKMNCHVPGFQWPSSSTTSIDGFKLKTMTSYSHMMSQRDANNYNMYKYCCGLTMPSNARATVNILVDKMTSVSPYIDYSNSFNGALQPHLTVTDLDSTSGDAICEPEEDGYRSEIENRETGASPNKNKKRKRKQLYPSLKQQQYKESRSKATSCDYWRAPSVERVPAERTYGKESKSNGYVSRSLSIGDDQHQCTVTEDSTPDVHTVDHDMQLMAYRVEDQIEMDVPALLSHRQRTNRVSDKSQQMGKHKCDSLNIAEVSAANMYSPNYKTHTKVPQPKARADPNTMTTTYTLENQDNESDTVFEDDKLRQLAIIMKEEIMNRVDLIVDRAISVCCTSLALGNHSNTSEELSRYSVPLKRAKSVSDCRRKESMAYYDDSSIKTRAQQNQHKHNKIWQLDAHIDDLIEPDETGLISTRCYGSGRQLQSTTSPCDWLLMQKDDTLMSVMGGSECTVNVDLEDIENGRKGKSGDKIDLLQSTDNINRSLTTRGDNTMELPTVIRPPSLPSAAVAPHHHSQYVGRTMTSLSNRVARAVVDSLHDPDHNMSLKHVREGLLSISYRSGIGTLTGTLTPVHLRKAKLMFFYVRYPSSSTLRLFYQDVAFNQNNTAQMIKWFSNFREYFYIQIEKCARQALNDGILESNDLVINVSCDLFRILCHHYNRNCQFQVPDSFRALAQVTLREFHRSLVTGRDRDPSWKKSIYKIIARLDDTIPDWFSTPL